MSEGQISRLVCLVSCPKMFRGGRRCWPLDDSVFCWGCLGLLFSCFCRFRRRVLIWSFTAFLLPESEERTRRSRRCVRANGNPMVGRRMWGAARPSFFLPVFRRWFRILRRGRSAGTHHKHHRRGGRRGVAVEPVYIPYAVPYPVEMGDDAAEDEDEPEAAAAEPNRPARWMLSHSRKGGERRRTSSPMSVGWLRRGRAVRRPIPANGADENSASGSGSRIPTDPPAPVVAQPTTVLIFKDGHRVEVVNYAIVGATV